MLLVATQNRAGAYPDLGPELLALGQQGAYVGEQLPPGGQQRLVLLGAELQPLEDGRPQQRVGVPRLAHILQVALHEGANRAHVDIDHGPQQRARLVNHVLPKQETFTTFRQPAMVDETTPLLLLHSEQ